jgi:hypothetical protein
MYITLALAIFGLFGIAVGVYSLRKNWKWSSSNVTGTLSRRNVVILIIIGAIVGIATWPATYFMGYPLHVGKEVARIVGVPFFVAYFDAEGADFVGPLTMPGVIANSIFWFLLPQTILFFVWRRRR